MIRFRYFFFFCLNDLSFMVARKIWYVFELHRFAFRMKNCYCIVHRSFYMALLKFQYINIFCSFLMIQIGTKVWYVFKLYKSDLHCKISHRIQYYCFTEYFKNLNAFTIVFQWLKLEWNFSMILNFIDLIYIPKLVIVFSIHFFTWHFKICTFTFTVSF